jgi:hypothetical protein
MNNDRVCGKRNHLPKNNNVVCIVAKLGRARYSTVHLEQFQPYQRPELALRVTSTVLKSKDIIDGSIAEGKHGELSLYCG